ncbi:hypothetical protein AQUCO_09100080v1 [Aquilegia coerulea]|uniref:CR-type domain-containing protein n=1 Tax=Aquilegia coerulea TaxID=218851 RepID=A0A2G5C5X2_AQUCA|nr:hypothetical protein AQUCO_09100080v1 [Aquilegia coerulea]
MINPTTATVANNIATLSFSFSPHPININSINHLNFNFNLFGIVNRGLSTTARIITAAASSSASGATNTNTNKTDYYSTLNLSRTATLQQIKSSYRKLARQYHPDMNKSAGAEDKFKEISVAYEVLSDDEKRSVYDRFGDPGLQTQYHGSGLNSQGVDPFEIFDTYFGESNAFFGGTNLRNNRSQSLDIRYDLSLNFEESIFGGQKNIEVLCYETCDHCNGSGAKSSSCIKSCMDCGGRGGVVKSQRTPFGLMSQVSACSKCGGEGKVITDYCRRCDGQGKVQMKRSIKVVIPPGVNDGATMKVQGEGNNDRNRGIAGDLYLFVRIKEKLGVWREGLNLYSKINIDYTDAILGTVLKVETVEGLRDLYISPGIQPGDTIKLPAMGVPNINKPLIRGDHHFIVNVLIPKDISDTERTLVEKLASLKASCKIHSSPSNGIPGDNVDRHTIKTPQKSSSGKDVNRATSLWTSIKNFWGQKQSGGVGFASVSVEALTPIRKYSTPDVSLVISVSLVLLSTCICSYMSSIDFPKVSKLLRIRSHAITKRKDC